MISPKAYVDPEARIGQHVTVHPFAYIDKNVEIGDSCEIMPYASILNGTRMGRNNRVFQGAVIGAEPQDLNFKGDATRVCIGDGNQIRENVVINRATTPEGCTVIGNDNSLMEGVHVSHDVTIGNKCVIGYGSKIAGNCRIGDHVIFGGLVLAHQYCRVGQWAMVQGSCHFYKDVPPYIIAAHQPIAYHGVNAVVLSHYHFSEAVLEQIANTYRIIYQGNNTIVDALAKIEEQITMSDEIRHITGFIRESKRGIIR